MSNPQSIVSILEHIKDPACRLVAQQALDIATKALDKSQSSQMTYLVDEIEKIMPKALKLREANAATQD